VKDFDPLLAGQYRDLEPPNDAIVVSAMLPLAEARRTNQAVKSGDGRVGV
jgi:hypothetical protein